MMSTTLSSLVATQVDYKDYILDSHVIDMRHGGRFNQSIILTYEDGTEWVYLNNKVQERFCGFLYLQNSLKESNLNATLVPAENKMAIHDRKIIYLSKYCGEKKPEFLEHGDKFKILNNIGFIDMVGCANLRENNGKIYVFDTEKTSFAKCVYEKIDSFINLHDAIKSSLEEKLKATI